jgi:hypothetical protein
VGDRRLLRHGVHLFEGTGGYGPAFVVACAILVAAGIVSARVDDGARVLGWRTARA